KSKEGTPDEHEESFWVVQRKLRHTGKVTYRTDIVWDKPGTTARSGGSNKPRVSRGRIVMHAHTHPGPGAEHKQNDAYANDQASPADITNQNTTGVPSAVRYGRGADPKNTQTFLVPLPDKKLLLTPRELNWKCPKPPAPPPGAPPPVKPTPCNDCARTTGDPHLETHDSLGFDLQAAGEFVAVNIDGKPRLQVRLEPIGSSRRISTTTAVAMKVGLARVSIRPGLGLYVEGHPVNLDPSAQALAGQQALVMVGNQLTTLEAEKFALAGGGQVQRFGSDYLIDWPDKSRLWVQVQPRSLDIFFDTALETKGRTRGLFGVFNDQQADDLTTRDGTVIAKPTFEPLYKQFAESWRVTPAESLFDYQPGETTETFTDRTMPDQPVTLDSLDAASRTKADQQCRAAGIVDPVALDECTLDLALSGDLAFLASARAVQQIAHTTNQVPVAGTGDSDSTTHQSLKIAGSFRVAYDLSQGNTTSTPMVVSVDPPREAVERGGTRLIYDGAKKTLCTGNKTTMQCFTSDESTGLGQVGAFGIREDPKTIE
ncbi:MAG: VWD domain-containing protein, partial [Nannocystaceae bacterium]